MKDFTKEILESSRPNESVETCLEHCLTSLYEDNTHYTDDSISPSLTYEELIGALLLARDTIAEHEKTIAMLTEQE
jgi:hypothetical protein